MYFCSHGSADCAPGAAMENQMIKIEHLTKRFGQRYALNDVSFEIGKDEIVGFLGPNGAGKSTTMNILTGYTSMTDGTVTIDGLDILEFPDEAKKRIGYLPEQPPLYPDMTVTEYLNFVYDLKKCKLNKKKHIAEIMDVTRLSDVKGRLISNLSKGYRQRVGIAQALVGNPPVIILDEPTVGLDPRQAVEIRNLVRTLGLSHTVILSTHILSEVQAVCDRVIIINRGKIVADRRTNELGAAMEGTRLLSAKICGPEKEVAQALRSLSGVRKVETESTLDMDSTSYIIEADAGIDVRKPMFSLLAKNGWYLIGLTATGANLEDVFLSLTEKTAPDKKKKERRSSGTRGE